MINAKLAQVSLVLVMLLSVVAFSPRAFAGTVNVFGYVYDSNGDPVPFYEVTATCGTQTLSVLTGSINDELGRYDITFDNPECGSNTQVDVTGEGGPSGSTTTNDISFAQLDLVDPNSNAAVPEFGVVTGTLASVLSIGSFLVLKKRSLLS